MGIFFASVIMILIRVTLVIITVSVMSAVPVVPVAVFFVTALFMAAPLVRQVGRHRVLEIVVLAPLVIHDRFGGRTIEDLFLRLDEMTLRIPNALWPKVSYVVDTECAAQHWRPIEVVDGEHGRALVLVHEKAKAAVVPFGLLGIWLRARLGQVNVDDFAILRKNRKHVAFRHIIVQSTDINIRRVLVLIVPRPRAV